MQGFELTVAPYAHWALAVPEYSVGITLPAAQVSRDLWAGAAGKLGGRLVYPLAQCTLELVEVGHPLLPASFARRARYVSKPARCPVFHIVGARVLGVDDVVRERNHGLSLPIGRPP